MLDVASGELQPVPLNWSRGLIGNDGGAADALAATRAGFIAMLADAVHNRLARFNREGANWKQTLITGDQVNHRGAIGSARAHSGVHNLPRISEKVSALKCPAQKSRFQRTEVPQENP